MGEKSVPPELFSHLMFYEKRFSFLSSFLALRTVPLYQVCPKLCQELGTVMKEC